jgi:hypothetical protein
VLRKSDVVFWAQLRRLVFILAAGSAKLPHAIVRIECRVDRVLVAPIRRWRR